jgi:hypothetical protein
MLFIRFYQENETAAICTLSIRGRFRTTGICFERTLNLAEFSIENLPDKPGEKMRGCKVLSARIADKS